MKTKMGCYYSMTDETDYRTTKEGTEEVLGWDKTSFSEITSILVSKGER